VAVLIKKRPVLITDVHHDPAKRRRGRKCTLEAASSLAVDVPVIGGVHFEEYLRSPDSKVALLNTDDYEDVGDHSYRCRMKGIHFWSLHITPILTFRIDKHIHRGVANIQAIEADIEARANTRHHGNGKDGTSSARIALPDQTRQRNGNDHHHSHSHSHDAHPGLHALTYPVEIEAENTVRWCQSPTHTYTRTTTSTSSSSSSNKGARPSFRLSSDLRLKVSIHKPIWVLLPAHLIEVGGSAILRRALRSTLPEFVGGLRTGYVEWAHRHRHLSLRERLFRSSHSDEKA